MNEKCLFWIGHYSRKLHVDKVACWLAKHIISDDFVYDAEPLEKFWIDRGSSCICSNNLSETPKYDLQIVVPCYNVEDYVVECIESIIEQNTRFNYKIVIVNDGSTDGTREALKRFENLPNIQIIDQQNGGLSAARNAGIREIDAKHLLFVDSDDILMPNAVEALLTSAYKLNADIVEGGYERFDGNKVLNSYRLQDSDGSGCMSGFAWGKLYKSELFRNIQYPENYWYEDTLGCLLLFERAEHISTVSDIVYRWRKNKSSITSISKGNIKSVDLFWITKRLLEDRRILGMPFDSSFLETFLGQVKQNCNKIATVGDSEICKSVFASTRKLLKSYFDAALFQKVECSLLKSLLINDYKQYLIDCLLA